MASVRHRTPTLALFLCLVWLAAAPARAQDTHYWNLQYGPVATLLGGVVIGSTRDLSATFYNPGGLILSDDPSFLLSTESFRIENVALQPTSGRLFDITTQSIGAAPSLIAGNLPKGWGGRNGRLAWSYLTRQRFDIRLSRRLEDQLTGTPYAGSAEALFDQRLSEDWGGLTYSHALGKSVGLGITLYGAYRGQQTRSETSLQVTSASGAGVTGITVDDYNYGHARMLAKLGVAKDWQRWQAGVSVTTPSISVFGSGQAGFTRSVGGLDATGDGRPDTVVAASSQDDLHADYKSSWAVGAGAGWRRGQTRVHFSAEWYAPLDSFAVMDPSPFASTPSGPGYDPLLVQRLEGVLNAGVGAEHEFSRDVTVYGAFHTDFSAAPDDRELSVSAADWNLLHVTGGAAFRVAQMRFTLGVGWAFGSKTDTLYTPLPVALPVVSLARDVKARYSRLTFLLGFVFGS